MFMEPASFCTRDIGWSSRHNIAGNGKDWRRKSVPIPSNRILREAAYGNSADASRDGELICGPPLGRRGRKNTLRFSSPLRLLGIMRLSPSLGQLGTIPPPPTLKQSFRIATENSFDYSSYIFVGFTSALAEWTDTHPQLGEGMAGFGRYYYGSADKRAGVTAW